MFLKISWSFYWTSIAILVALYYLIIAVLYLWKRRNKPPEPPGEQENQVQE